MSSPDRLSSFFSHFSGFALLLGVPFFFLGGPGYYSSRSFQSAWNLGHIFYFALLSCWLHGSLWKRRGAWPALQKPFVIFLIVFFVGLLVEVLQMFTTSRSPDLFDLLRNQLGCLTAFAFFIRPPLFDGMWRQRSFRGAVLALIVMAVWPLAQDLVDEHLATKQFPVLADFETPFERSRWVNRQQLSEETDTVRHGRKSARVKLSTAKYSGIALFYFPGDWSEYQTLHYSIYIPEAAGLILNCRIHDALHKAHGSEFSDRFNQRFILRQGWNDVVVSLERVKNAPRGRAMDMQNIQGFGLFVVQQAHPQEIYLDHVYLGK